MAAQAFAASSAASRSVIRAFLIMIVKLTVISRLSRLPPVRRLPPPARAAAPVLAFGAGVLTPWIAIRSCASSSCTPSRATRLLSSICPSPLSYGPMSRAICALT